MKNKGRKKKFLTVLIYIKDKEVYLNGDRIIDEEKEKEVLSIFWKDICNEEFKY